MDVERSLWAFTAGWQDGKREEKRAALKRLLTAAVTRSGGAVHYYQGLHDIASVLLMTVGEGPAYPLLAHLTGCQLRDCTRCLLACRCGQVLMHPSCCVHDVYFAADQYLICLTTTAWRSRVT